MKYAGAVRGVAVGCVLVVVTACGGGGGSGGDGDGRPDVPLPNISTAHQKALTPDNSKQAINLALNTISFVQEGTIPAPASVDFYADSFVDPNVFSKASRKMSALRAAVKTVDVSDQICLSGSATADAGNSLIGKMVQHYRNCDTGDITLDGDLELDIRDYIYSDTFTDVTYTFHGLRMTDGQSDTVFDGTVVMTTAYPGAGFIAADLDIRDLKALKGIRVADYRADFDIDYASNYSGNYIYFVRQLHGRIYSEGEYVDLGLTAGHEPWPMLVGENSNLTLSPSGMAAPYQVRIALDGNGDNSAEYWLFADLAQLSDSSANNSAPEFNVDATPIRLNKGETREVWFGNVTDADQQFVSMSWQLTEKPEGSDPIVDASNDGFVFSSNIVGNYRFSATASDGEHATTRDLNIRVMYDEPSVSANAPSLVNENGTISFQVDVLNPEQGHVTVTPVAIPGLNYDANAGTATFSPAFPTFGMDQQVNLAFVVANEDREKTVTFPLTVRPSENSSKPLMLASGDYYSWSFYNGIVGQFTTDNSKELIEAQYLTIDLYEIESPNKRYRESFDIGAEMNAGGIAVLAAVDVDGDGDDEILLLASTNDGYYLGAFDTQKRKIIHKTRLPNQGYDMGFNKITVADIDRDGELDIALLSQNEVSIFDANLDLLWQSEPGNFGSHIVAANIDQDAALELVTDTGYILDGATRSWQARRGFYASGSDFFAADVNHDGISEIFLAGGNTLSRMTDSGYVALDAAVSFYSNVVVRNVDSDVDDEIVFVTSHDPSNVSEPFAPSSGGVLSLGYLDFDGFDADMVLVRELQQGSSYGYQLNYADVDGNGSSEYFAQLQDSGYGLQSFIYHEASDSQEFITTVGVRLNGGLQGGDLISQESGKLLFCGGIHAPDGVPVADLFTFDTSSLLLGKDFTWSLGSDVGVGPSDYSRCSTTTLGTPDKNYIVSLRNGYNYINMKSEIKIQDSESGETIFSKQDAAGQLAFMQGIGDIDGDDSMDIVVAGNNSVSTFDILSGDLGATMYFNSYESIYRLAVGDVLAGNNKDEIVLQVGNQLVIAGDNAGALAVIAQRDMGYSGNLNNIRIADVTGDAKNEIVYLKFNQETYPGKFEVHIMDSQLQTITQWSVNSVVDGMVTFATNSGSVFLVSLEREAYDQDDRVIWRNPMTGQILSRSDEIGSQYLTELHLLEDPQTAKVRAVMAGGSKIYISQ